MRRTTVDCDSCGKKDVPGAAEFSVDFHTRQDGAGSSESYGIEFDLCPPCQSKLLAALLRDMEFKGEAEKRLGQLLGKAARTN